MVVLRNTKTKADVIVTRVAESMPEGISFNKLAMTFDTNRSAVHRRVARLLQTGRLVRVGDGSHSRLQVPAQSQRRAG